MTSCGAGCIGGIVVAAICIIIFGVGLVAIILAIRQNYMLKNSTDIYNDVVHDPSVSENVAYASTPATISVAKLTV